MPITQEKGHKETEHSNEEKVQIRYWVVVDQFFSFCIVVNVILEIKENL